MFHTANYDAGYDLRNKRVAVIGSGSSGVQTVATIEPHVSKLYTWVRNPTWITAGFAQKYAGENGGNFHCEQALNRLLTCFPQLTSTRYRRTKSGVAAKF